MSAQRTEGDPSPSCNATLRRKHPADGKPIPCKKTGVHARLRPTDRFIFTPMLAPIQGPFRDFFCAQHVREADAERNFDQRLAQ